MTHAPALQTLIYFGFRCVAAARKAHPNALFETDAQEVIHGLVPFITFKTLGAKVRKLESETKMQQLRDLIDRTLPLLKEALALTFARIPEMEAAKKAAEEAAAAKKLQQQQQQQNEGLTAVVLTAVSSDLASGPILQTAPPVSNNAGTGEPSSQPGGPVEPPKPRFPWTAAVEEPWYKIVCAELELISIKEGPKPPNPELNTPKAFENKSVDTEKLKQQKERWSSWNKIEVKMYQSYCDLWISDVSLPVSWQSLRQTYVRVHKRTTNPTKPVNPAKKPQV